VKTGGVEGVAEVVGGEDVEAAVAGERGHLGHRLQEALHAGAYLGRGGGAARRPWRGGVGSARQVEEVGAFDVVELQGASDSVQHAVGDADEVPLLKSGVVVDGHPRDHRHLFPPQTRRPAVAAEGRQSRLPRGDLCPAADEEVADLAPVVHRHHGRAAGWCVAGRGVNPDNRDLPPFLVSWLGGMS
jgi:hypothetical protein